MAFTDRRLPRGRAGAPNQFSITYKPDQQGKDVKE
jgi:hypothetical protein